MDDALQTILELLRKISDKNKDLAIRRFNSAYEKTEKADKLLDLMITCEALFSDATETDAVTHKLAWRFSRLLGDNAAKSKDLYQKMKKLYTTRSQVVHGNNDYVANEKVEQAEDYMRRSLNGYLCEMNNNSFEDKKGFLEYLDFEKTR